MPAVPLKELVQALADAVVQAQNAVETQQISLLSQFFDQNGRPNCMQIMVPRMGIQDHDTDYNLLNVPLISLVEATMLHITEFEVSFDVELSGFGSDDAGALDHAPDSAPPSPAAPALAPGPLPVAASDAGPRRTFFGRLRRGAPIVSPDIGPKPVLTAPDHTADAGVANPAAVLRDPAGAAEEAGVAPPTRAMIVGLGPKGSAVPTAKATLKVSSRSMSDGMVRLLNHLNKTF